MIKPQEPLSQSATWRERQKGATHMQRSPALPRKRRTIATALRQIWPLYLFLLPAIAYILIFSYYPMYGAQIAFREYRIRTGIAGSDWVGLKHIIRFITNYQFPTLVRNTLTISLYGLVANFVVRTVLALCLNCMRAQKYKKVIQTVTYMPHFISTVVLVGMMNQILNPVTGLYSNIYRLFNPGEYPIDILSRANAFDHLYVWSGIWQNLGWNTIIYMAALSGVDPALHEAAQVDGASRLRRVLHIDLPVLLPTASIMLIMNAGTIMSVGFEKVYLMQNSVNSVYSEVISTYVYKTGLGGTTNQMSYAAAIGLFNNVINGILLLVVNFASSKLSGGAHSLF